MDTKSLIVSSDDSNLRTSVILVLACILGGTLAGPSTCSTAASAAECRDPTSALAPRLSSDPCCAAPGGQPASSGGSRQGSAGGGNGLGPPSERPPVPGLQQARGSSPGPDRPRRTRLPPVRLMAPCRAPLPPAWRSSDAGRSDVARQGWRCCLIYTAGIAVAALLVLLLLCR